MIFFYLLRRLYKEWGGNIFTWLGIDPDSEMNCFLCSKKETDWIVPEVLYNKEFKNWRGPIHNGKFRLQTFNENSNTEYTCTNYTGSLKFNGITREVMTSILIKSYKDKCREHMISNTMWDIFYLPDPFKQEKKWDTLLHHYRFPLDYLKLHVKILQRVSKEDKYVVQNRCIQECT